MDRLRRFIAVAFALLCLVVVAGACRGGGGGSDGGDSDALRSYFERVAQLSAAFNQRGADLAAQYDFSGAGTDEEKIQLAQGYLDDALVALQDFLDGLRQLDPPPEAEDVHNEGLQHGDGAIEALRDAGTKLQTAQTSDDLQSILGQAFAAGGSFDRLSNTCSLLQDIADQEGAGVDLSCGI